MADYTLTWIGDQTRTYKTKGGEERQSTRIAVRDAGGERHTKLELTRPASQPMPSVGDSLQGSIMPHPKFDDLRRFVEGAGGEAAPATNGGGGTQTPAETSRTESIERQVALKVAGVVVASYVGQGAIKPEEFGDYIDKFTQAGVDALRGRKEPEGKPEEKAEGGTDIDSDIPF